MRRGVGSVQGSAEESCENRSQNPALDAHPRWLSVSAVDERGGCPRDHRIHGACREAALARRSVLVKRGKLMGTVDSPRQRFAQVLKGTFKGRACLAIIVSTAAWLSANGSASAAECPNESLRSDNGSLALPDCRAYEQVTPSTKNGAEFNSFVYISPEGPRLSFESLATFGGTEFTSLLGTAYEIARGPMGWSTHPLGAPATTFEGTNAFNTPLYSLGSEGGNLLGLRRRGQPIDAENIYRRAGSAIVEVGPEAPPASLRGLPNQESITSNENFGYFNFLTATPDLSHVVFELFSPGEHNYLWPFDRTGEGFLSSAYEYVGTGNSAPLLIGVTGGLGSQDLVSGCGTSVGAFGGQELYNAVSASGSTIYFTPWGEDKIGTCNSTVPAPPHTELFARIDGDLPSAHTVPISEPSSAACAACQTANQSEAMFQGASEDGSKSYFLTEQELLPGNPGKNLYEYSFNGSAGEKVTAVSHLASNGEAGVLGVVRVSADGSHVYFVATSEMTTEPNSTGARAEAGQANVYVYDSTSKALKFVATLAPADSELWKAADIERPAQATPDGRFLIFTSTGQLTPDDTSTVSQLFRYDAATGQLARVSVGQHGYNNNGNTTEDPIILGPKATLERHAFSENGPATRLISDDGSYVYFESTLGLTPKALNHVELPNHVGQFAENVYQWHNGEITLISDGRDTTYIGTQILSEQRSSVRLLGITPAAEDVFFTTASALSTSDVGGGEDIYDARVDGGLPTPQDISCESDACQPQSPASPSSPTAGSSEFAGPGNAKPKKPKHHKKKKHKHRSKHKSQDKHRNAGKRVHREGNGSQGSKRGGNR